MEVQHHPDSTCKTVDAKNLRAYQPRLSVSARSCRGKMSNGPPNQERGLQKARGLEGDVIGEKDVQPDRHDLPRTWPVLD